MSVKKAPLPAKVGAYRSHRERSISSFWRWTVRLTVFGELQPGGGRAAE